jgi:NADH-quinone oxidoreductase subunit I
MPGQVILVRRRGELGLLQRLYVPSLLRALGVTARHFFRNLGAFATGRRSGESAARFPEERVDYPDAFRGMPVLVALESGEPRCVACGLCEFACPTDCITIVANEGADAEIERTPETFDIDMSRCMFCGLCEEACPEEAIVMSCEVEIAAFDRAAMRFRKQDLLVPAALLERRLAFLRADRERSGGGGRLGLEES